MWARLFSLVTQNVTPHCLNVHLVGLSLVLLVPVVLCHYTTWRFFIDFFSLGILTDFKITQEYLVLFQEISMS